jgi:hypothetical protein
MVHQRKAGGRGLNQWKHIESSIENVQDTEIRIVLKAIYTLIEYVYNSIPTEE